jgi:hypothetical protein
MARLGRRQPNRPVVYHPRSVAPTGIFIRGGTPVTAIVTVTNPISVTLTGSTQPQAGDVLLIIHGNDFYTASAMPTPTVGGSTSGVTPVTNGSADAGTNLAHIKSYYYVVGSTGDLTVSVTETGLGDEEKSLDVYVLSGVDTTTPIDIAATSTGTTSTSQVAPSISPTRADSYLICHVNTGGAGVSSTYTPPAGMTETYDTVVAATYEAAGAVLQLSASGATGTKTFTATGSNPYASLSVAMKSAAVVTTPPTFPASADLIEGLGTSRAFAAVTTQAGDYLVIQAGLEADDPTWNLTVTGAAGLTWTLQNDSLAGTGIRSRVYQWTALDATGGSRTVSIGNTVGTSGNYRARLTVVRGSAGPGGKGVTKSAQTVSVTRTGNDSAMFMNVNDWSAGAVGTPTWTPGGSTVASQQGTGATYIFGRWDDSGTAAAASHGISTPSFTTPAVAVLEMLGTTGSGGGSATATPSTVAGTATIGTATLQTGATVSAGTVAAAAAVAAPTVQAGATAAPATVAAVASIDATTVRLSVAISPATVAAVAAVGAPAVSVGGSTTVSASTVAATTTVGTAVGSAGATVSATTVAAVAAVGAPTVQAGAKPVPATVAATTTVGTAALATGSTVTAATVAAVAAITAPTVQAGAVPAPSTVAAVATVGTAALHTGATATPGTVAAVATIPTPSLGGSVTVNPSTVAATATIGGQSVSTGVIVAAATVAATAAVGAPTIAAGAKPTPSTVAAVAAVGTPSVGQSTTATPPTVAAVATVPAVTIRAGAAPAPATVAALAAIGGQSIRAGVTIPVFTVAATASVGAPTVSVIRAVTHRPFTGTTARPSSGTTSRPYAGITPRP